MGRHILFLTLILFIVLTYSATVYGLTPDEKNYFDSQNKKTVAQINSKIDKQINNRARVKR